MGVVCVAWGEVGQVGIEILGTLPTVVLRISEMQLVRASGNQIAQIVQRAPKHFIACGGCAAVGAGQVHKIPLLLDDLGARQVFGLGKANIGDVFARSHAAG